MSANRWRGGSGGREGGKEGGKEGAEVGTVRKRGREGGMDDQDWKREKKRGRKRPRFVISHLCRLCLCQEHSFFPCLGLGNVFLVVQVVEEERENKRARGGDVPTTRIRTLDLGR